ncbi:MAG: hypothetical protein IT464_12785 [Planctomycetes bacterium]|nr:hypothetical protein [Planctomycetota bacterium]
MGKKLKALGRVVTSPLRAARGALAAVDPVNYPFQQPRPKGRRGPPPLNTFIGVPAPAGQDWRAGGAAIFRNAASGLGSDAYSLIRSTDCTADPPAILGAETAKNSLLVYGLKAGVDPRDEPLGMMEKRAWLKDNSSERAKWLQLAYDNANGLEAFLANSPWALIYEVLFWQIRYHYVENFGYAPDLEWGERLPKWAGGHLLLDPNHRDIVVEEITSAYGDERKAETIVSPRDWIMLKPGASGNPRGAGWLAVRFFRNAQRFQTSDAQRELFAEQMSIPVLIIRWLSKFLPVGGQSTKFDELEETLTMEEAMQMLMIGENRTIGDLLVYPTDGVEFLDNQETRLKARCMIALMHTALLADTRASGPTGSSKEARVTANAAVLCWAWYAFSRLTRYVNPALVATNEAMAPGSVPPLQKGELPPVCQPVAPGELEGDSNPTKGPAADKVQQQDRPMPEGTAKNEKGNDKVK